MSIIGKFTPQKILRGRINRLDILTVNAYEIAVKNGFEGTEEEWLESLKGKKGEKGDPGAVQTVAGIEPDANGNVPMDWVAHKIMNPQVLLEETAVSEGATTKLTYEMFQGHDEVLVTLDGTEYLCAPKFSNNGFLWIGNRSISLSALPDTGEPFCITNGGENTSIILMFEESGGHTMSVAIPQYEYAKLPEEYLPESVASAISGNHLTLTDQTTGKKYKLSVNNGKLTMEVV